MQKKFSLLQLCASLFVLVVIVAMASCNKAPGYTPPSLKSAVIYDFWLEKTAGNPAINRPYQGMILGDTAIRLMVDYGTDITALEPTVFAETDSILPKGKQNFSSPVRYTVYANGKTVTYTVRITVSPVQSPVFTTIAAGFNHVMALKNDGTVWVCGENSSGQLGLGDYSSRNKLTQVPVYDAAQIFTGEAASIIKLKDGTAWGTGNQYGQLGIGNKNPIATLTRVPFLDDALQVAITFEEVIALKSDGSVWGAGRNLRKVLAQGDAELHATFVRIPVSDVKQLSGTGSNIIVQKNNGELWGWGDNFIGQLGVGDMLIRELPVLLPAPPVGVAQVFAGSGTTYLIDNNGKVWATGANAGGQMGVGDLVNRNTFTRLSFFDDKAIDFIACHLRATGFKESNGKMWNVGDNVRGIIGLGTKTAQPYTTPLELPGFVTAALAGNGSTAYALKPDGTLWAWGANSSGALGTGRDTTDIASPIQIK